MRLAFLTRSGLQKAMSLLSISTNIFKLLSKVRSDSISSNSKISSVDITIRGSLFVDLSQVLMFLISVLVCLDTVFPINFDSILEAIAAISSSSLSLTGKSCITSVIAFDGALWGTSLLVEGGPRFYHVFSALICLRFI